jgi:hypothetical protein
LSGRDAELAALSSNIPGIPGEDYPIYAEVPESAFSCEGQVDGGKLLFVYFFNRCQIQTICKLSGYYADAEAECQVFHICTADGKGGLAKYSFLCPNGTIFNQNYFICDWWFNFDCSEAETLYSLNDDIAAERDAAAGALDGYGAPEASESRDSYAAPAREAEAAGDYAAPAEVLEERLPGYDEQPAYEAQSSYLGGEPAPVGGEIIEVRGARARFQGRRGGRRQNGRRAGGRRGGRAFRG